MTTNTEVPETKDFGTVKQIVTSWGFIRWAVMFVLFMVALFIWTTSGAQGASDLIDYMAKATAGERAEIIKTLGAFAFILAFALLAVSEVISYLRGAKLRK